jgi:hypothetical protein
VFSVLGCTPLCSRQKRIRGLDTWALRQGYVLIWERVGISTRPFTGYLGYPSALTVERSNPSLDNTTALALRSISETIKAVALADGQNVSHAAKYVNYALFGTPLEDIYGGNLERLREIRAAIDLKDVMGLTGGWKF